MEFSHCFRGKTRFTTVCDKTELVPASSCSLLWLKHNCFDQTSGEMQQIAANLCDRDLNNDRAPQWWLTGNGFLPWRLRFSGRKPATGSVPHLSHRKCAFIFHALPSEYLTRCLFLMDSALQWEARSNLWGERTWNADPVLWFRAPPPRHQRFSWFFSSASERFSSNDAINTASWNKCSSTATCLSVPVLWRNSAAFVPQLYKVFVWEEFNKRWTCYQTTWRQTHTSNSELLVFFKHFPQSLHLFFWSIKQFNIF